MGYEMRRLLTLMVAFTIVFLASPPTAVAQDHRLTTEISYGIVGFGDIRIPSGQLGYSRQIVPHLDLTASIRFSRTREWEPLDTSPGLPHDLSYLDGTVGLELHPIDSDKHRLDLGLSAALRGRWETRTTGIKILFGPDDQPQKLLRHETDRRTSADTGFLLSTGYNYKITPSLWLGAHLRGYTYQEGTSLFLFGLSVDYTL